MRPITLEEVARRLEFAVAIAPDDARWWRNWAQQMLRRFDEQPAPVGLRTRTALEWSDA